jgi:hypothetical protein
MPVSESHVDALQTWDRVLEDHHDRSAKETAQMTASEALSVVFKMGLSP